MEIFKTCIEKKIFTITHKVAELILECSMWTSENKIESLGELIEFNYLKTVQ